LNATPLGKSSIWAGVLVVDWQNAPGLNGGGVALSSTFLVQFIAADNDTFPGIRVFRWKHHWLIASQLIWEASP
jgi:hypothetical protein